MLKNHKITTLLVAAVLAFSLIAAPAFAGTWGAPDNPTAGSDTAPVYYLFYDNGTDIVPVPHGQGVVKGYDNPVDGTVTFYFKHTLVYYTDAYVEDIEVDSTSVYAEDEGAGNGEAVFNLSDFELIDVVIDDAEDSISAIEADFYLNFYHDNAQTYYLARYPQ
ncbi:MAG: hypothetical protein LBK56_11440 [Gracilibacteraceae bacterium]|jgi:hypothetical protein|nr:hypothetical protein [Gracilibacteraceae bacterium]